MERRSAPTQSTHSEEGQSGASDASQKLMRRAIPSPATWGQYGPTWPAADSCLGEGWPGGWADWLVAEMLFSRQAFCRSSAVSYVRLYGDGRPARQCWSQPCAEGHRTPYSTGVAPGLSGVSRT